MADRSVDVRLPVRRKHVTEIVVAGDPDEVFALMCPVREHDWVEGWQTGAIWSESGLVEDGCIFTTPLAAGGGGEAVWVTTLHDRQARRLGMVRVVPALTVTRLEIAVLPDGAGGSRLSVGYELSALSDAGAAMVAQHTAAGLAEKIRGEWKPAIERVVSGGQD